jgi:hypothetical protein
MSDREAETLLTYMGQPIKPHRPSFVEAEHYYCSDCGLEVGTEDGDFWFHLDLSYEPSEDER